MALIAQAVTLESRIPVLHFFDGFRTSHELNTIELLTDEQIRAMIDDDLVRAHRARALNPEHPFIRGTAHNPDTFFQARETVNPFYAALPGIVQKHMDRFAALTGRQYHPFDFFGPRGRGAGDRRDGHRRGNRPNHSRGLAGEGREGRRAAGPPVPAVRCRGVAGGAAGNRARDRGAGADQGTGRAGRTDVSGRGRDARPGGCDRQARFSAARRRRALRPVVEGFLAGLGEGGVRRTGARRCRGPGLPSASTTTSRTPAWPPIRRFRSIRPALVCAVFYGLGADGTVGANKNTVKIIAEDAGLHAQGYFVYDSHKSGAQTISHLRFGEAPIRAPYPDPAGELRGDPSVSVRRTPRRVADGGAWRHRAAERAIRSRADLGPTAARDAGAGDPRQAAAVRHRCLQGGRGCRPARAHQYHPANLLLRPVRRAAARPGDRRDQEVDQEDLRQARRGRGQAQLPGRGRHAGPAVRGDHSRPPRPPTGNASRRCPRMRRSSSAGSPR